MFMLTGESFLVNKQRKQQFHLKSPILVLSQIKLDHLAMWGFIPTGFWQGESQQTFFVAVPTNRSTFLKVQQNLGIFLSIPKNISIFSGATFFYWFFEYPNSVSRRVWPLDFIVVVECCWVMKWDLVRPCRCGRIFRLLQLRKFVGRKRCHDDEYALCYKCIVRNVYIYI